MSEETDRIPDISGVSPTNPGQTHPPPTIKTRVM